MRFRALVLLVGLVVLAAEAPALFAAERVFEPAPEYKAEALEVARIEEAIKHLQSTMLRTPPTTARALDDISVRFGNDVGLWTDTATISNTVRGLEFGSAFESGLENFGLAFAAVQCLKKQLMDGKPAGLDMAYESFKFLLSKAPLDLGPWAAVVGVVKWGLDSLGNFAVAIVNEKFYQEYRTWCLGNNRDGAAWMKLLEGGPENLDRSLAEFWTDPATAGLRGIYLLETSTPDYRKAMAGRFMREVVFPLVQARLEDMLVEAEADLIIKTQVAAAGFNKREVVVVLPSIINEGSGRPARDLMARLVYDAKFLLAEFPVQGAGARFTFPAGKLLDPTTRQPRTSLTVYLTPRAPAVPSGREWHEYLSLTKVRPSVKRSFGDTATTYTYHKPIVTDVRYEVTVEVDGTTSSLKAESTCPGASSLRSPLITRRTMGQRQGSSFLFKDLPAGPCTFVSDQGKAGQADIVGPTRLTLTVRPPQATTTTEVPQVDTPDFAASLQAQLGLLKGLRSYGTAAADLWARATTATAELARRAVVMEAEFKTAKKVISAKQRAVREMDRDGPDSPEKDALEEQVRLESVALSQAEDDAKKQCTAARKAFEEGLKTLNKQVLDDGKRLETERRDAERELRASVDEARREADEADRAITAVFQEDWHDYSSSRTAEAADAKVVELEAIVADLEARLARVIELVSTAGAQRARLDELLSKVALRATARDEDVHALPDAVAGLERLQGLVRLLKEQRAAELTARAMRSIKKKHAQRRRNSAELARLMAEAQTLAGTLPAVDEALFETTGPAFAGRLAALLASDDPAAEEAGRCERELRAFLDAQAAVCADLRSGSERRDTAFSRLTTIIERFLAMQRNRLVHQRDSDVSVWTRYMEARDLRVRLVEPLVGYLGDARAAAADLTLFRTGARSARSTLDEALGRARKLLDRGAAAPQALLTALDEAWAAASKLPSFQRPPAQARVHAMAEELVATGRLETWAQTAKRPLVLFTSYYDPSTPEGYKNPTPLDRAFFRPKAVKPGQQAGSYVLKGRVVGLPPRTSCIVSYGPEDWPVLAPRLDDGTYHLSVTPQADASQVRILGTGPSAPPLAYPWLRQVVFE